MENNRKKGTARVKFLKHIDKIKSLYAAGYCEKDVQRLSGLADEMSYQTFRYNLRKYVKEEQIRKEQLLEEKAHPSNDTSVSADDLMKKLTELHEIINVFGQEIRDIKHSFSLRQSK